MYGGKLILFLVLLVYVALTLAGEKELSEYEMSKVLELWRNSCLDGNGNENSGYNTQNGYGPPPPGQEYGSPGTSRSQIYCKFGKDYEDNKNTIVVRPTYATPREPIKQVIFIQPPVYNTNHEITLTGPSEAPRKTIVYVFPQKSTHKYNVQDDRQKAPPLKPTVYYLRNNVLQQQQETGGYGQRYAPAESSVNLRQVPVAEPLQPNQPISSYSSTSTISQGEPDAETISNVYSSANSNIVPVRLVEPIKRETVKSDPGFEIVPADFKGYYYSGPSSVNDINQY